MFGEIIEKQYGEQGLKSDNSDKCTYRASFQREQRAPVRVCQCYSSFTILTVALSIGLKQEIVEAQSSESGVDRMQHPASFVCRPPYVCCESAVK